MSLKLSTDILQYIFYVTGQHAVGVDLTKIQMNLPALWLVLKQELLEYQRYFPVTKKFNIETLPAGGALMYDFTGDPNNVGYDPAVPSDGDAPTWISKMVPVGTSNTIANMLVNNPLTISLGPPGSLGRVSSPRMVLFDYRKPKLYPTEAGKFDITAHYNYWFIETKDTNQVLTEVEIFDIDAVNNKLFLDLCAARFLMIVGRQRRAFTYANLPITTDAEALVTEATAMYEDARKQMTERQQWFRSVRH